MTAAALLLLGAAPVFAQSAATTFEELRFRVRIGDTVYLTDDSGGPEREARVLDLTASSLAVSVAGIRRDLAEGQVRRIRRRVPDSLRNGALLGFAVGAALSTTGATVLASPTGSCKARCVAINALFGGSVGAGLGIGIDSAVAPRLDVYVGRANQASRRLTIRPFVMSGARGLNVAVAF